MRKKPENLPLDFDTMKLMRAVHIDADRWYHVKIRGNKVKIKKRR